MAKLLIIDDDKELCIYFKEFFSRRGCQVTTSLSAEEGILSFEKFKPELVLLDIKLPGADGLEVLKKIKEKNKDVFVLMFSFITDAATQKKAYDLGANGFIKKPFNMAELEGTVCKMLFKTVP